MTDSWTPITERLPERKDADMYCQVWWTNGRKVWSGAYNTHERKGATHWQEPRPPEPPVKQGSLF